ncbi:hypothetical protein TNCV_2455181 [Trichonephila clavipes]|nr:hypothetical protein TNCV_2455181 [Trichonephila clavipes]
MLHQHPGGCVYIRLSWSLRFNLKRNSTLKMILLQSVRDSSTVSAPDWIVCNSENQSALFLRGFLLFSESLIDVIAVTVVPLTCRGVAKGARGDVAAYQATTLSSLSINHYLLLPSVMVHHTFQCFQPCSSVAPTQMQNDPTI